MARKGGRAKVAATDVISAATRPRAAGALARHTRAPPLRARAGKKGGHPRVLRGGWDWEVHTWLRGFARPGLGGGHGRTLGGRAVQGPLGGRTAAPLGRRGRALAHTPGCASAATGRAAQARLRAAPLRGRNRAWACPGKQKAGVRRPGSYAETTAPSASSSIARYSRFCFTPATDTRRSWGGGCGGRRPGVGRSPAAAARERRQRAKQAQNSARLHPVTPRPSNPSPSRPAAPCP